MGDVATAYAQRLPVVSRRSARVARLGRDDDLHYAAAAASFFGGKRP
jgi:hypothetical protein